MNRKWLLLGGLALVLVLGVYLVDRGRASSTLGEAYTVRDAGERCFSELASGFDGSGPSGVSAAMENGEFALWAGMSKSAAEAARTPIFFGKDRVLALSIAAKQYDELVRVPRGTWLTLTHEIADKRSRLDAAIIAVEMEDVSSGSVASRRAESKAEIVRVARTILDAQEKAPKAEEGSGITDEQRHAATERSMAEYAAENGMGTASTPPSIDFSRARPPADDAAREAQENITPATPAEQRAIVAERCRKAGRSNCGPPGSEKADAEIVANWRVRSGLAPAPTPALTRK